MQIAGNRATASGRGTVIFCQYENNVLNYVINYIIS